MKNYTLMKFLNSKDRQKISKAWVEQHERHIIWKESVIKSVCGSHQQH